MAEDAEPGPEPDQNPTSPVDEGGEAPSAAPSTPSPVEALARKAGWKPKEEWKGDTTNWTDADEYVAHALTRNNDLKDQVKQATRMAEAAIKKDRERSRRELEERLATAVAADDLKGAREASDGLADLKAEEAAQPPASAPQEVSEFVSRNAWFNTDADAKSIAVAESNRLAALGRDVQAQLAGAEAEVRRRRPDLFPEPAKTRTAPMTEGGQRTTSTKTAPTSIANLPPDLRKQAEKFVRLGMLTEKEALAAMLEA